MTPALHELEPRLTPSVSPFPEVPSHTLYLADGEPVWCAGSGGGPRVVQGDQSFFVADPSSRMGVDVDGVRWLLGLRGERVVSESETPAALPEKPGVPVDANSISRGFGLSDATIGVGILFDTPPGDSTQDRQERIFLPQFVWTEIANSGKVDPYSVFVAIGDEVTRARSLGRYVEVELSGPGPFSVRDIAADVLGRL